MSKSHRKKGKSQPRKSRPQSISSEHIEEDFKNEPQEPVFFIKTSKAMGRYMVAKRCLESGEVILKESPLVVGPCSGGKVQCVGCYVVLKNDEDYVKCSSCSWPLCSNECNGLNSEYGHTKIECSVLKECNSGDFLEYDDFDKLKLHYNALVPLRCLILKSTNPDAYETIMDMEGHTEIRKNIPDVWSTNQTYVVDRILKEWKLTEFTEEEIHQICGKLEVNAFEIGQQGISIRGLYPTAFLMSHDCIPNTCHADDENFNLTVRAAIPISKNQPISLSYAYTLQNTIKRREHLLENKFFECRCHRCCDPTEVGTHLGTLICPKCKCGNVVSTDSLSPAADLACSNKSKTSQNRCPGYFISSKSLNLLINRISSEVEAIDCNDVKSMEIFLQKYRNVLHPTHYLCLGVKLSLSQLYGKAPGYLIYELSEDQLKRKKEICSEILKIFDIIEPGYTKLRGVTLYELHAPLMILLTREFERGSLNKSTLRQRLREIVKYLEESSLILSYEPKTSSEYAMGVAAKDALMKIKDWEKIIGKI